MIWWVLFSIVDGMVDAFMFHKARDYDNKLFGIDIHKHMSLRRLIVLLVLSTGMNDIIAMMCIHPLIHNGAYFETRKRINGTYTDGFFTSKEEDDSTAIIDFDSFYARFSIAIIGMGILYFNIFP